MRGHRRTAGSGQKIRQCAAQGRGPRGEPRFHEQAQAPQVGGPGGVGEAEPGLDIREDHPPARPHDPRRLVPPIGPEVQQQVAEGAVDCGIRERERRGVRDTEARRDARARSGGGGGQGDGGGVAVHALPRRLRAGGRDRKGQGAVAASDIQQAVPRLGCERVQDRGRSGGETAEEFGVGHGPHPPDTP